jgi:hypothetical protein
MNLHKDLTESEVSDVFQMSDSTDNEDLRPWLHKTVRYKRSLLTPEFIKAHGTICLDSEWVIEMTQLDWSGNEILRGFLVGSDAPNDTFGRPILPEHIELVS